MSQTMIPDAELIAAADVVTLWVATRNAPTDMWSLAEAIAWVMRQPDRQRITLFRPPDQTARAAWLKSEQIERVAAALACRGAANAA